MTATPTTADAPTQVKAVADHRRGAGAGDPWAGTRRGATSSAGIAAAAASTVGAQATTRQPAP